jgi:hypothetical protein
VATQQCVSLVFQNRRVQRSEICFGPARAPKIFYQRLQWGRQVYHHFSELNFFTRSSSIRQCCYCFFLAYLLLILLNGQDPGDGVKGMDGSLLGVDIALLSLVFCAY